jgi:mannosyl-3-phosphoglycerate phosphatase
LKTELKTVIFADIDGTILDDENSFEDTQPIIKRLIAHGAVLVLCSTKTKAEIEFYQKKLDITDPFIVENGGAIFIPKGYFPFPIPNSKKTCEYDVLELGIPYSIVREKLAQASTKAGVMAIGFGDMSADTIAATSRILLPLAVLAKKRMYDEPLLIAQKDEKRLEEAVKAEGLSFTFGGKYFHVGGYTNKGKAATILKQHLERKFGNIVTYGIGDSQNDLPLLTAVNVPMLVRRKFGGRNASLSVWRNLVQFALNIQSTIV